MIEGEAQEIPEETILEACQFAKPYLKKVIDFQEQITTWVAYPLIPTKKRGARLASNSPFSLVDPTGIEPVTF